jgi:peptide/nickel transport system substrate-binding protein
MQLYHQWEATVNLAEQRKIWQQMLLIHRQNIFTIGLIAAPLQPISLNKNIQNLPDDGMWNWNPGAHFGVYGLDRVWFNNPSTSKNITEAQ